MISRLTRKAEIVADLLGEPVAEVLDGMQAQAKAEQGEALLTKAVAEPTLNRFLDRSPKLLTDRNYGELVLVLHRKRAAFITAEQKKKEPKIEGEPNDEA